VSTGSVLHAINEFDPLQAFSPLTLQELDHQAELMERQDSKYIGNSKQVMTALAHQASDYRILEINNNRSFRYENHYFDTRDLVSFHEHKQGKRKRFKVRTRYYADTDTCFLELKLKGPRNRTVKSRIPYPVAQRDRLDDKAMTFIKQTYEATYDKSFEYQLEYSLSTVYQRSTLVSTRGTERLTIDAQLAFTDQKNEYNINADTAIVETKSAHLNSASNKVIRAVAQQPLSACSKYCMGLALLGKVEKYNRFRPAIRKLVGNNC